MQIEKSHFLVFTLPRNAFKQQPLQCTKRKAIRSAWSSVAHSGLSWAYVSSVTFETASFCMNHHSQLKAVCDKSYRCQTEANKCYYKPVELIQQN